MGKIRTLSLFSGGGGLDLGFEKSGFDIIFACDVMKEAVDTYNLNLNKVCQHLDLNSVDPSLLPDCDVIIGGPPCQAFSLSGKRNVADPRAKLVFRYLEIIKCKRPLFFLIENVTGILSAKTDQGTYVLDDLKTAINHIGYDFSYKILNAADYGVPQLRKRVLLAGFVPGLSFSFPSPTRRKYITVFEALSDLPLPSLDNDFLPYLTKPTNKYQEYCQSKRLLVNEHYIQPTSKLDDLIIKNLTPGGNYMDLPRDIPSLRIQRLQKFGGHTTCYGRLSPDKPSYTINTYFNRPNVGCNVHYSQERLITVREALRLQSFPDDYVFPKISKKAKNTIVGNAVPPLLSKALAGAVKKCLMQGKNYVDKL